MQATKALPRLDPRTHPGAIVPDMTPNYLCSPKALRNMVGSVGTPATVGFLYRNLLHCGRGEGINHQQSMADTAVVPSAAVRADPSCAEAAAEVLRKLRRVMGFMIFLWLAMLPKCSPSLAL